MTKLLERAIVKVSALPREAQDLAAKRLLESFEEYPPIEKLSIEEVRDAFEASDFLAIARWRKELGI